MKMLKVMIAALALTAVSAVDAAQISLDLRPKASSTKSLMGTKSVSALSPIETGVLRKTELASGSAKVDDLAVGDTLRLQVYDDVNIELTLVARDE